MTAMADPHSADPNVIHLPGGLFISRTLGGWRLYSDNNFDSLALLTESEADQYRRMAQAGGLPTMTMFPADPDDDGPPDPEALSRALAIHDALPDRHRPSDREPLRNCLAGIWPSVGDLRALLTLTQSAVARHPDRRRQRARGRSA